MLDHILIPLDGSPLAEEAIAPAKKLLKTNGKFTLVSVVEIPPYWQFGIAPEVILDQSDYTTKQMIVRAKEYLENIAANLRAEDFRVEVIAQYGDAATVITEIAAEHKVDAISMSTHGRSGWNRLLFGSITGKVLSAAPCPVFVIPSKHELPQMDSSARKANPS